MKYLLSIFLLTILFVRVQAQEFDEFKGLEFSKLYGIGDLHLDQVKSKRRQGGYRRLVDSSAYQEYQLMRFLISEREVSQIFIELPVNYQLYLDRFFASGDLGELKLSFPDNGGHAQLKLSYLRKLKDEFPKLEVYCSESGDMNPSLYYLNNLFFEVSNQIFGNDTARLDIFMDSELAYFLQNQYERQLGPVYEVTNNGVLDGLLYELIEIRFSTTIPDRKRVLNLSRDWLEYLKSDSSAAIYFNNSDHLQELIFWFLKGASLKDRQYQKKRDEHISDFINLKSNDPRKSAILLFGNSHLSPSWRQSKNLFSIFNEKGVQPVIIEIYYAAYPYSFISPSKVNQALSDASSKSFVKLDERNWILYLDN